MAIIKYNAVHTTPKKHLRYILNPSKNEELKYVTGICCNTELDLVYADFRELFEMYDDERYALRQKHDGKNHIRIHSYIQSFAADEVTPEEAHKIGVEWCKAMFGEDRPVIITTHTNTDHCHNHIAVCPYDIHGNKWKANKTTLKLARTVSDRICLEHDLSVIRDPKRKSDMSYAEWLAVKGGRSWKVQMADDIDRFIHDPSVTDVPSLIAKMKENGYVFTDERLLIARPANAKRACSLYKLGYGYRYNVLEMRILQKQSEFLGMDTSGCSDRQLEMISLIQRRQKEEYRKKAVPKSVQIRVAEKELHETSELLCYMSEHNIHSLNDFMNHVNEFRSEEIKKDFRHSEMELAFGYGSEQEKLLEDELTEARRRRYKADKMYLRYLDVLREVRPFDEIPISMPENGMLPSQEVKERRRLRRILEEQEAERNSRSSYYR